MKKVNFLLLLFVISVITSKAQTYSKGTNVISAGIGLEVQLRDTLTVLNPLQAVFNMKEAFGRQGRE